MQTVADLMTTNLVTITANHSMKNVHDLITKKGIRHIPIIDDDSGKMIGLITQKAMIAKVISLRSEFGSELVLQKEMQTPVMDVAITDFNTISSNMSLKEAAEYFLQNKNKCLCVLDNEQRLIGMLTSSDFVKLALSLLG